MKTLKLLQRNLLYICAFISVGVYGQREADTVKVILLVCDTGRPIYVSHYATFDSRTSSGWVGNAKKDTLYLDYSHQVWWKFGFEVLEKHNTAEGKIDPRHSICIDERGEIVDCHHDYWVHKEYLDKIGDKLPKGLIVWKSVRRE